MYKYIVLYYIKDDEVNGVNSTQMRLAFPLNNTTLRRAELKLKHSLNVQKVIILSYKLIEQRR